MKNAENPLRVKGFRRIWAGEALSLLGDRSFDIAFVWLVFHVTGSPAALAAILVTQAIPRGVLLLVGGAITDRFSPRIVMMASHLLRGSAVGLLGGLAIFELVQLWHLFVLGALIGISEAFFGPASGAVVPQLLPSEQLARGNALVGFAEQGSRLAGPIIGAFLITLIGLPAAILVNAMTFFVAIVTLVITRVEHSPAEPVHRTVRGIVREIGAGLHYARGSFAVRTVLLIIAAAALSYSGVFAVGLPALAASFHSGPLTLGILLSAWGLGQLVGTVGAIFTGLPRRWGLLILIMTFCEGLAFALLGLVPDVWLAAVILGAVGIGVAYSADVALPTFVQTSTPKKLLGRINSVLDLPRAVLEPVSIALMGVLVAGDLRWAFACAAIPMLAVGVYLALNPLARGLSTNSESPT